MLISLKEYSLKNGKHPDTARQAAGRGSFKTAVKIGRDWLIDSEEPWPRDMRMKNVTVFYNESKDFPRMNDCAEKTDIAVSRLENPYNISDEDYIMYQDWLFGRGGDTAKDFIDLGEVRKYPLLVKYRVINKKNVTKLVEYAQEAGKTDALSFLLNAANFLRNGGTTLQVARKKSPGKIKPAKQILPSYRQAEKGDILWLGKAPIPWIVTDKKDGALTLLSKFALDCLPYNQIFTHTDWEGCSLRRWLNRDFSHRVFSDEERGRLKTVYIDPKSDGIYDRPSEGLCEDNVWLLSMKEAEKYFPDRSLRRARVTAKAKGRIMWASFDVYGHWWLRSPGADEVGGSYVREDGAILDHGGTILSNSYDKYYDHYGVRPAVKFVCED